MGEGVEGCYNNQGRCIVPPSAKKRPLPPPVRVGKVLICTCGAVTHPYPQRVQILLQWSLNAPMLKQAVDASVSEAQELIADLQLSCLCFDEFGKGMVFCGGSSDEVRHVDRPWW